MFVICAEAIIYLLLHNLDDCTFNDLKFNHNFKNCINPLCSCSLSVENNVHFFLHCHQDIIQETDRDLVNILFFGSSKYQYNINSKVLSFSTDFILETERIFDQVY